MKINILKISTAFLAGTMMLNLSSCNDWLSVSPAQEVEDTELFKSQQGFKEALAGVYSSMVNERSYSKEMMFGAIGILADEWDNMPTSYQDLQKYDYDASVPTATISGIWAANYNSIANANNILKHIDNAKGLFSGDNYEIIKGETLGLRAFLHFDLLRCFGVSYAVNPNMPSIPYVTEFTYKVFPQLKVNEVVAKILGDLQEAEKLLKNDPILTGREITELDDAGYLMNRTVHFNYYAVKALQARVNMWAGNYSDAYNAAKTVYDSGKFQWATQSDMMNSYDLNYVNEQIFALNNVNMQTLYDSYFSEDAGTRSFSLDRETLNNYYDNENADLRYTYQWIGGSTGDYINYRFSTKYGVSKSEDLWYQNKMSLIRLSEMLLIMAEADFRNNGSGLDKINELREARNLETLEALSEPFLDYLVKEYRRDFIGEGQLFFLLKRLNIQYIPGTDVDAVINKSYTFPLPLTEIESAERKDNR